MYKCWLCGKDATQFYLVGDYTYTDELGNKHSWKNKPGQRKYCNECFEAYMTQHKQDVEEYARLKKSLMYERALREFESQHVDIYDYQEAFKAVEELSIEHPEKFDSSDEMIAAAVLIQNHVQTKVHYKVGHYEVDFLLPELHVALEIDGDRHKNRILYDSERDITIREELGPEWEIVRIPAEHIEENAKVLIEAITSVRDKKKELREKNCGFIPDWYSPSDSFKYEKIKNYRKKRK